MGVLDDAKFAVAKINAMKSNGATSIKSAIAAGVKPTEDEELAKCVATFTQGYPEWVADGGVEPLYGVSYYPATKMAYICISLINRYEHYAPDVATNNYCPFPEPDADGIYPYVYGMMVWPGIRIRHEGIVYKCIMPAGTYKLVNTPAEAVSIFEKE